MAIKNTGQFKGLSQRAMLLFLCVIYLFTSFSVFFSGSVRAQSDDGRWVDKVNIIYDGRSWRDRNPYDGENEWVGRYGECEGTIKVINFDSPGTRADVEIKKDDGAGNCITTTEKRITLSNAQMRKITAYRQDDNNILVPIGFKDPGCAIDSKRNAVDSKRNVFRKPERGVASNVYYQVKPDGGDPPLEDAIELTVNSDRRSAKVNVDFNSGSCADSGANFDLAIAAAGTAIPDLYETADGEDGGSGGDGDDAAEEIDSNCDTFNASPLSWVLCPLYNLIEESFIKLADFMENMLRYELPANDSTLKTAWSNMRTVANIMFVLGLLVVIISQAVGGKM